MKATRALLYCLPAAALLALSGATRAPAQDPAVVNAHTVRVKFENDKVRVMEAVLKPGDKENPHSHPAYVVYIIDGGRFRNHRPDGRASEFDVTAGATIYAEPTTHWSENIGKTTIRLVMVELKGR